MAGLQSLPETTIGPDLPAAFTATVERLNPGSIIDRSMLGALRLSGDFAARLAEVQSPDLALRQKALSGIQSEIAAAYRRNGGFEDPMVQAVDARAEQIRAAALAAGLPELDASRRARLVSALSTQAAQLEPYLRISPKARAVVNFALMARQQTDIRNRIAALENAFADGRGAAVWSAPGAVVSVPGGKRNAAKVSGANLLPFVRGAAGERTTTALGLGAADVRAFSKTVEAMDLGAMRDIEFDYFDEKTDFPEFKGRHFRAAGVLEVRYASMSEFARDVEIYLRPMKESVGANVLLGDASFPSESAAKDFVRKNFLAYDGKAVAIVFSVSAGRNKPYFSSSPFWVRKIELQPAGLAKWRHPLAAAKEAKAELIPALQRIGAAAAIAGAGVSFGLMGRLFFASTLCVIAALLAISAVSRFISTQP